MPTKMVSKCRRISIVAAYDVDSSRELLDIEKFNLLRSNVSGHQLHKYPGLIPFNRDVAAREQQLHTAYFGGPAGTWFYPEAAATADKL